METNNVEKVIDIKVFLKVFKKYWIFLLIATVLFGAVGGVYTSLFEEDRYRGTAYFWVNSVSSSVNSSTTMGAAQMAANYIELIGKDILLQRAVAKGNLREVWGLSNDLEAKDKLAKMLTANKSTDDSFSFYVSATASTPKMAYEAIGAIQSAMPDVIAEINGNPSSASTYVTLTGWVDSMDEIKTISRNYVRNIALAAIASFLLTYAAFFLIVFFDKIIYDENAVKGEFSYPIVGVIPSWGMSSESKKRGIKYDIEHRDYGGKLLSAAAPFAVNEAFNMLRTNLAYMAAGEEHPVIALTSSNSGEGKSILSSNIAISFSSLGKKTLLIECDMRCSSFANIFGTKDSAGLSEYLGGLIDRKSLPIDCYNEHLDILRAGKIPPNPSELLASEAMKKLIAEQRVSYDVIILDMPPICEVADAGVVADIIDGYVLVVRAGHSDMNMLKSAEKLLRGVNGNILGFIFNGVDPKTGAGSYYHKNGRYSRYSRYAQASQNVEEK